MRSATAFASSSEVAVPLSGCGMLELVEERAEALAVLGQVDRVGARAQDLHARALERQRPGAAGVCPPNWITTPSGFSSSRMFITSSKVRGSK